jgi:hypothetical protein
MLALEASVLANSYSRKVAGVDAVRWIILPMVEDFETLTLVYKALDLKTRDLVELGAFRDSSVIELIPLLEDAKGRFVWNTSSMPSSAQLPPAAALLKTCGFSRHLRLCGEARTCSVGAGCNTRIATDRRHKQRGRV